jgi:hypothetical protein
MAVTFFKKPLLQKLKILHAETQARVYLIVFGESANGNAPRLALDCAIGNSRFRERALAWGFVPLAPGRAYFGSIPLVPNWYIVSGNNLAYT